MQRGQVSDIAIDLLRRTKGWVMFLAVLGYIGSGLMLFCGLMMVVAGGALGAAAESGLPLSFSALGFIYIAFTALYIYPCVKLHQYARGIKALLSSGATIDLETALDKQRAFWKFCGILAIVIFSIYALIFIFAIIGGIATAAAL